MVRSASSCVVACLALAEACAEGPTPRLSLDQLTSIALPEAFEVVGFAWSDGRAVNLWSRNTVLKIHLGTGIVDTLAVVPDGPIVGVAPCEGQRCIEVIDGDSRLRRRFVERRTVHTDTLPFAQIFSAVLLPTGWLFSASSEVGAPNAVYRERRTLVFDELSDLVARLARDNIVVANLAHDPRGAVVSSAMPPFVSYLLDPDGSVRVRLRPALVLLQDQERGQLLGGTWLALPPVCIETGFLQTFVDRRSGHRVHALYDGGGDLVRSSETAIPLAFVGSSPEAGEVLAVRRTSHPELITYRVR